MEKRNNEHLLSRVWHLRYRERHGGAANNSTDGVNCALTNLRGGMTPAILTRVAAQANTALSDMAQATLTAKAAYGRYQKNNVNRHAAICRDATGNTRKIRINLFGNTERYSWTRSNRYNSKRCYHWT